MESSWVVMKITSSGTIKLVQAIHSILTGMTVYNIKDDQHTLTMSCVDQTFQLIWRTITA